MNLLNAYNVLKAIIALVASFILILLGAEREKNKQRKAELKSIKNARKIEAENSKLTRDELIDLD